MAMGPNIDETTYPEDQKYRVFKFAMEDGSTLDYKVVWWDELQMSMIPDEHRAELSDARDAALWLGFEALFKGELPGYGKAVRIISEWYGPKGSEPPWWKVLR